MSQVTEIAKEITDAIVHRQQTFAGEDLTTSCMVVLWNYGDRWTPVRCVAGEWTGLKRDITSRVGLVPSCPNGHVLLESPDGRKRLGLVDDTTLTDLRTALGQRNTR